MTKVNGPINFPGNTPLRVSKPFSVVEVYREDKVVIFSILDPSAVFNRQFINEVSSFLVSGEKVIIQCGKLDPYTEQELMHLKLGIWSHEKFKIDKTKLIATELLPDGEALDESTTGTFATKIKNLHGIDFTSAFAISYVEENPNELITHLNIELEGIKPEVEENSEKMDYKVDEKEEEPQIFPSDSTNKSKETFCLAGLQERSTEDVVGDVLGKLFELVSQRGKTLELVAGDSSNTIDDLGIEIGKGGTMSDVNIVLTPPSDSTNQDLYTVLAYEFIRLDKRVNLKRKDFLGNEDLNKLEISKIKYREIKISLPDFDDSDFYNPLFSLIRLLLIKGEIVVLDIDRNRPQGVDSLKFELFVDNISEGTKEIKTSKETRKGIDHPVFVLKP